MSTVHERIEEIRKKKNIPKAVVAQHLGITPMGYHHISVGKNRLSVERMQIIAQLFEMDPKDLL
ncbi:hypothetical protein D3C71_1910060 [compost metagenome]